MVISSDKNVGIKLTITVDDLTDDLTLVQDTVAIGNPIIGITNNSVFDGAIVEVQFAFTLNPDEDDWVALRDDKLTISEPYKRFVGTIQKIRFKVIEATEKTNLTILIQPSI